MNMKILIITIIQRMATLSCYFDCATRIRMPNWYIHLTESCLYPLVGTRYLIGIKMTLRFLLYCYFVNIRL